MEQNIELQRAWEFAEHTGRSIFLTGKAGTGKTTFLKMLRKRSRKRMVVVAPTGVAAINAGGVTIHSFFQLPLSPYVPGTAIKDRYDFGKEKRKIISTLDMLVIDEISMVRSDLLDAIDFVLRRYRSPGVPFGGVQLLMIGDLQQLTPVVTADDEEMLRRYYDTPYFFGSRALQQMEYVTIQLEHVFRQQDHRFVTLLNHIREAHPTAEDLQLLNSRCKPLFRPLPEEGYIRLTTHNIRADRHNEMELRNLPGKAFEYAADISGTFPDYAYPTNPTLRLKTGTQVMFIKNDPSADHRYFNGKIGRVTYLDAGRIEVTCPGETEAIEVEMAEWENVKYVLNEQTKEIETQQLGVFRQYPLRLAWAITIHKSQGLTFERAIIDAGSSFAPGQVYVALSRCKTLEGMVLATPVTQQAILSDTRVDNYIARQEQAAAESVARLPELKQEYERSQLLDLFNFTVIGQQTERLNRLFIDHLGRSYPQLTALLKQASIDLQEKVITVAYKWTMFLRSLPYEQWHAPSLEQRTAKSIGYFLSTLDDVLGLVLERVKTVQVGNKEVAKRLGNISSELLTAYRAKKGVLQSMLMQGYTLSGYMQAKQKALLGAMEAEDPKPPSRQRKKAAAKPKAPKEPTREHTLRLFRAGLSIEKIAKERGLVPSTIFSHLAFYARKGDIPTEVLVPKDHQLAILKAMKQLKGAGNLHDIKLLCPPDVTFEEIRFMMAP